MKQRPLRVFGRVFIENTYEAGLQFKLIVKDITTCTIFCVKGYTESRDAETGVRRQDNFPGTILRGPDYVAKEYDLLVTEPAVVFCYDRLLNDGKELNCDVMDFATGDNVLLPQGTNLFLCEGSLCIEDRVFVGPTAIAVSTGAKVATAQTRCLGLKIL